MPTEPRTPNKFLHIATLLVIALAGVILIAFASHPAEKDYISYWSAGHLLLQHANPYAGDAVFTAEKSAGYTESRALLMRNPPWALFLAAPLGLLSPLAGLLLWTFASLACIAAFIPLGKIPTNDALLIFLFAPALASLCAGQSSPFLLLGFILFLHWHNRRPFASGLSLLLMAIKPHLFFIFWIVLLLDAFTKRGQLKRGLSWLAGLTLALAATTTFALYFDHNLWPQYIAMLHQSALETEFLPTLSEAFRMAISTRTTWLIFVPTLIGLLWAIAYYWRNRAQWNWNRHGLLLVLVAVVTSPYGWFSDQIVLLPVIAIAFFQTSPRKFSREALVLLNSIMLFITLVLHPSLTSPLYLWTPAAWLAWFLYASPQTTKSAIAGA